MKAYESLLEKEKVKEVVNRLLSAPIIEIVVR
jgi:hypothetical protein